jgi:peptidoglycan/LPS O-acetylase OafA/YrhL
VIPFFAVPAICLVQAFLAGVVLFSFKHKIPHHPALFAFCVVISCIMFSIPYGRLFVAIPAAYVTVFIGLTNPARNWLLLSGDYSYGIFLYGYPIQQSVAHLTGGGHWLIGIAAALPITFCVAVISWWIVERPVLGLRKYIPQLERRILRIKNLALRFLVPTLQRDPLQLPE